MAEIRLDLDNPTPQGCLIDYLRRHIRDGSMSQEQAQEALDAAHRGVPNRKPSIDTLARLEAEALATANNPNAQPHPDLFGLGGVGASATVQTAAKYIRTIQKTGADIIRDGNKERPWLVEGLLPSGAVTVITGHSKSGKTTLLFSWLKTMEQGGEWCGLAVEPGLAWIYSEEGSHTISEVMDATGLGEDTPHVYTQISDRGQLDWDLLCAAIAEEVSNIQSLWGQVVEGDPSPPEAPRVIVIDTIAVWAEMDDWNSYGRVTKAFTPLKKTPGHHSMRRGGHTPRPQTLRRPGERASTGRARLHGHRRTGGPVDPSDGTRWRGIHAGAGRRGPFPRRLGEDGYHLRPRHPDLL